MVSACLAKVVFRSATPLPSEDADAFISRLEKVFDRWVELSEIRKGNYEQLRDLILRDQIYTSMHSDIVMFLKDRLKKFALSLINTEPHTPLNLWLKNIQFWLLKTLPLSRKKRGGGGRKSHLGYFSTSVNNNFDFYTSFLTLLSYGIAGCQDISSHNNFV